MSDALYRLDYEMMAFDEGQQTPGRKLNRNNKTQNLFLLPLPRFHSIEEVPSLGEKPPFCLLLARSVADSPFPSWGLCVPLTLPMRCMSTALGMAAAAIHKAIGRVNPHFDRM